MGPGMFDGVGELLIAGLIAIVILAVVAGIGLLAALWWIFSHVSVAIH